MWENDIDINADVDAAMAMAASNDTGVEKKEYNNVEVYKKWFKAGSNAGFISVSAWWDAQKFTVDIGSVDPNSNAVKSSTKCFVDMVQLGVYLRSIVQNNAVELYPLRSQCPSPESFVAFGGSGETSRVFKIHYWGAGKDKDGKSVVGNSGGFAWKCGHFVGKVGPQGQIEPVWNERKSADMIRVSRLEMHELSYRVDLALIHLSAQPGDGVTA